MSSIQRDYHHHIIQEEGVAIPDHENDNELVELEMKQNYEAEVAQEELDLEDQNDVEKIDSELDQSEVNQINEVEEEP